MPVPSVSSMLHAMNDIARQIRRIQAHINARVGNRRRLALRAGLGATILTGAEQPDWNPRAETLQKLVLALDAIEADAERERARPLNRANRSVAVA